MFQEDSYEPLAELYIYLNNSSSQEYLYCLCSRALIRSEISEEEKAIHDAVDPNLNDEVCTIRFLSSSTESQPSTVQNLKKKEQDEGVSSHCSTDDSTTCVRGPSGEHHSDSGADLSGETCRPTQDDTGWEEFWNKNGEGIIWESWIDKYGQYVDPGYCRDSNKPSSISGEPGGGATTEVSNENCSELTRLSFCSEVSDSLTNVTPLTLSELSAEDSSFLSSSDSATSVSASELSTQWQTLWTQHFNSQYLLAYENYCRAKLEERSSLKPKSGASKERQSSSEKKSSGQSPKRETWKKKSVSRTTHSVGYLLKHLKTINMTERQDEDDDSKDINPVETSSEAPEESSSCRVASTRDGEEDSGKEVEKRSRSTDSQSWTVPSSRGKLKRGHDREDDRLEAAFSLIGLSYSGEGVSGGSVVYKKRNIRWQNRILNLNSHIHFDEDGNVITKDKKREEKSEEEERRPPEEEGRPGQADDGEGKSDFSEKDDSGDSGGGSGTEETGGSSGGGETKRRKKKKKRKGLPKEIADNPRLIKYWYQRYRLFSRFDEGIKLDEESWYSVTPEKISQHTAERCRCDLIIDACCGAGGNTIQFAFTCERVIAIDIDPQKIELAKHNARIYGVEDRIEFIVGDFVALAPTLTADVVFLSPPWGGLDYFYSKYYHLDRILPPLGGLKLFQLASNITPNVAMFLPKNVNTDELLLLAGPGGSLELEQNFLGKKLIAVTSYFGDLCASYQQLEEEH